MIDAKESIFKTVYYKLLRWFRQNFFCRFGHHNIQKVFADDESPNPEYCTWCDIGWEDQPDEPQKSNWFGEYP